MDEIVPGNLDDCTAWNDPVFIMRHVVASHCNNTLGNCRENDLMSRPIGAVRDLFALYVLRSIILGSAMLACTVRPEEYHFGVCHVGLHCTS